MFVYPTWWSGLPAILKGWLERVMVPGVGFRFDERTHKVRPGLGQVRHIIGISTYGSPTLLRPADQRQRTAHPDPGAADELRVPGPTDMARAVRDRHVDTRSPRGVRRPGRAGDGGAAMTRALVVYCHPLAESFVAAVRDRVLAGLATGGAEVRFTDLYADGFDPGFTASDHANHLVAGTDPSLASYAEDLQWCDTLVLVYPTWWSGQPAMLKGWIDRVWVNGVAWTLPEGANRLAARAAQHPPARGGHHPRLAEVDQHGRRRGRQAHVTRSLRTMCHPRARTTWLAIYGVDTSTDAQRAAFLDRVERRLTRLA